MVKVFGIPNCNTVKKALDWLQSHGIEYTFHNYKKDGVPKDQLKRWTKHFGWEIVVNKKGTTWRSLSPDVQANIKNQSAAIALMLDHPSVIRRPVIENGDSLLIGFNPDEYAAAMNSGT